MSYTNRLEEAVRQAESASEIARQWANGPENTNVATESGPLPTIAEFLRQKGDRIDSTTNQMMTGGLKSLQAIEGPQQAISGFYAGLSGGGGTFFYNPFRDKSFHDGGNFIAPEAISAWDGTATDLSTLLSWSGSGLGVFERHSGSSTILDFGARADHDARTVIQHMLSKDIPVDGGGGYFQVAGSITKVGSALMERITLEFLDGGLSLSASVGEWVDCAETKVYSGALPGIEVAGISCSKLTFSVPHNLNIWDVVRVASNDAYPWIGFESKAGQMAVVIATGSDYVLLDRSLEDGFTYNKVCKYSDDKLILDISVLNKNDLPNGVSGALVSLRNYVRADVAINALESYYQLVSCLGLYDSDVTLKGKQIRNYSADRSKWGYGIVDRACESCRFLVDVRSLRHGYTTTHGGAGTEPDRYGEPRNNTVSGRGINCVTPFDTHLNGTDIVYQDCVAVGSYAAGFSVRSRSAVLNNCQTSGGSDVGFFVFSNAPTSLTEGRGGVVTLNNCSSIGHKRFLRVGHQDETVNTALPSNRIRVKLNDCTAECSPYTEIVYAFNSSIEVNNLTLTNNSDDSSVTEASYTESNPIFLRGFIRLQNSEFIGNNVTFRKTGPAQKIYPFVLKTDRSLYSAAECRVVIDGLELDNSTSKLFTEWGEFVVSQNISGKRPSNGAIDYTSGLEHTFVILRNVGANTQSRANVMREDVLAFYKNGATSNRMFGWTPCIAKNFNPSWPRTLFIDGNAVTLDGNVDTWELTEKPINVMGDISPVLDVRVAFLNDGVGVGVLRISEIRNLGNMHSTQVLRVFNTNGSVNNQVSIKDGIAFPNDSANKGRGQAAEFWCNSGSWLRTK